MATAVLALLSALVLAGAGLVGVGQLTAEQSPLTGSPAARLQPPAPVTTGPTATEGGTASLVPRSPQQQTFSLGKPRAGQSWTRTRTGQSWTRARTGQSWSGVKSGQSWSGVKSGQSWSGVKKPRSGKLARRSAPRKPVARLTRPGRPVAQPAAPVSTRVLGAKYSTASRNAAKPRHAKVRADKVSAKRRGTSATSTGDRDPRRGKAEQRREKIAQVERQVERPKPGKGHARRPLNHKRGNHGVAEKAIGHNGSAKGTRSRK